MPEHDKSKEVYDYALKMSRNYAKPRDIVDFISNTKHNGYDASYNLHKRKPNALALG